MRLLLGLAFVAFAELAPAYAEADPAKISDLVDDLRRIQVQIAQGDKAAYAAQFNQLKTIGAAIAAAESGNVEGKTRGGIARHLHPERRFPL